MGTAKSIMDEANKQGVGIYLPIDVEAGDSFSNDAEKQTFRANKIPKGWMGLDAGIKTLTQLQEVVEGAKVILWNGPMGVFEFSNFAAGTKAMANYIATATSKGAFSLIGGGDSVAAIKAFNMADKVSYVSTGGGAMLEYLEGKELPGVKAITQE
jgi:phosphoglycerate kinase